MNSEREVLFEGEHLRFVRSHGWEYVEHRKAKEAVMVVAFTPEKRLILADEFRPAIGARMICLPAGLVGDVTEEEPILAAARELREETGYEAGNLEFLGRGPGSAGASSEIVNFYLGREARLAGDQAPEDRDLVRVHVVSLMALRAWTSEREREGVFIDPKVWAGLYLAAEAGVAAAAPREGNATTT